MAKDPAFLFMSKDWIEGTAEFMPDEKGVFIDLLCHQHQKGDLPNDTVRLARMVGLNHDDFLKIWKVLEAKFERVGERLLNRRLEETMIDRSEKGWKNTITGTFSSLLRKGNFSQAEYKHLRKNFKIDDFINENKGTLSDRLSDWIVLCLKSIGNAIGNGNEDENGKGNKKGGVGEKIKPTLVLPFTSEDFVNAWNAWKAYKKSEHGFRYKSTDTEQISLKDLSEVAKGNEKEAIRLIQHAIAKNWRGFYPINKSGNQKTIEEKQNEYAELDNLADKFLAIKNNKSVVQPSD